jgi:DNA-directed RNA polymerase subunit K/omega
MSDEEEYLENIDGDEDSNSESDDDNTVDDNLIIDDIEDMNVFRKNYDQLLKENKSSLYLNKYEITKILCKRCEQLENGCQPLIKDYEIYDNVYDIALRELNNKLPNGQSDCKIPFILKRLINNKYEYFKLNDLIIK